ncbi:MAG TPA: toll/interleukin-1 receptor domain-containing protein [Blastocatellia bacterium]|nr:toll/interleukin-1 receptor domain-containing protein [Blastocatellia bacterium]
MKSQLQTEKSTDEPRVFISYTSKNLGIAARIDKAMRTNRLKPVWDRDLSQGEDFAEEIKRFIAFAHIFLPIITTEAVQAGWVHQEIGYALALRVPILPVTLGDVLPDKMIRKYQALRLNELPTMSELTSNLPRSKFDTLIRRYSRPENALYENAQFAVDRAKLFVEYAANVLDLGYTGCVRQKGALSSFHIPKRGSPVKEWDDRMGIFLRDPGHRELQMQEREGLELHAAQSGCRLIINPYLLYADYGEKARISRLGTLVKFLESRGGRKAQVVINPRMHNETSVTLVGNWFAAESASATVAQGYKQTIFTRHAPTVQRKIDYFDQEFEGLLTELGWTPRTSRERAIKLLKDEIRKARKAMRNPASSKAKDSE